MNDIVVLLLVFIALILLCGFSVIVARQNTIIRNDERMIERLDLIIQDLRKNRSE